MIDALMIVVSSIVALFISVAIYALYKKTKEKLEPENVVVAEGWTKVELTPAQMREFEKNGKIKIDGFDVLLFKENRVE